MAARTTLDGLLGRASVASRVQFVAALYEARGFDVCVDGPVVIVAGERVLVAADSAFSVDSLRRRLSCRQPVDRVFAVDESRAARLAKRYDATALTSSDLDRLARYGIARDAADALFEQSFGCPVSAVAPPARAGRQAVDKTPVETLPVRRLSLVVLVAVVVVFATGGGSLTGADAVERALPWTEETPTAGTTTNAPSPSPTASPTASSSTSTEGSAGESPSADTDTFAPGVSAAGLTDVDALAAAHETALADRSYRWELSYVETVNGTVTARGTELVAVQSPRRFVSTVAWAGSPVGFSPVASHASYADGSHRYRPTGNATNVSRQSLTDVSVAGEQAWRASRAVRWYLSASTSSLERTLIHAQTPTVVLVGNGTAYRGVEAYQVRAHVTSDGLVQSLSVSYALTADEIRPRIAVQFTFRYRLDDDVAAPSPPWYVATD